MYLIVYKDAVNPAHWSIFVTQPGSERVGTLIHVKSSLYGGFEHEVKFYNEETSRSQRQKIEIGRLDERHVPRLSSTAMAIDANGVGCNLPMDVVSRTLFHVGLV